MARLNILCGLNNMKEFDEVERRVGKILVEHGYEVSFQVRTNKVRVKEYVENNDCDVVILQEKIDGKKWTAEEVAQLTEQKDVNVIIVLSDRYIGKEYVKTLLIANITNAIFQKGRNGGASAKDIADLIMRKRSRKDAREYYGIGGQKIDLGILDEDTYTEYYKNLREGKHSLLKNYVDCCAKMSPQQIADFTRRLPDDDLDILIQYEEFHIVMQLIKKMGYDLKIKKPKKVMIGLNVPQQITFKGYKDEKVSNVDSESVEVEKEEVQSDVAKVTISDSAMEDMSAADLLACISGEYDAEKITSLEETNEANREGNREEEIPVESATESAEEVPVKPDEEFSDFTGENEKENISKSVVYSEEDIENARREAVEEEKRKYEAKLHKVYADHDKAMKKQEKELLDRQYSIVYEQEGDRARENIAYQKEIDKLQKKQNKLERKLEKYSDSTGDYILDAGGKQFSWGVIVVLILLVAVAMGLVYFKPILF